jgi:AcrR family transcriptional regulator
VSATAGGRVERRGPGRPPADAAVTPTRERIVAVATELFAARGHDAVGLREIATAVGVDVATVHHHVGSKAALRDAVFERMFEAERVALHTAARAGREQVAAGGEPVAALHAFLDAYLEFLESHPEVTALWLRRWLEPDAHTDLDAAYSRPLYALAEDLLRVSGGGPDPHVVVRSIVWAVHGHVTARAPLRGRKRREEDERFAAFAHALVDGLYGG